MAPFVKLAVVCKSGEESSFLQKSACLHLLYILVEKQPYLMSTSSYQLSVKSILLLMCIRFHWCLQNHMRQNGG